MQAVRRLTKRTFRARERRFLAEGPQAVREALGSPGGVLELYATRDAVVRHDDLVAAARAAGVDVQMVSGAVMAAMCQTVTPQGVVAVCPFLDVPLDEIASAPPKLVTVLADARDPGNAGTVVRTADAAGADAVVLAGASVDPYNGKCVRASAGSIFHVDLVRGDDPYAVVAALRAAGIAVLAASGHGDTDLDDLADSGGLARPTAWLFGSEAHGLPDALAAAADARVRVPMHGRAESLNLAAAAAVCLYASAKAQRSLSDTPGDVTAMSAPRQAFSRPAGSGGRQG